MLSVKSYPLDYVESCRRRIHRQLDAYDDERATETFRTEFLHNMIVVLEHSFVHRMRGNEGKNGNPLNEVRMLAASILTNDAQLAVDSTIRYDPDTAVLGIAIGDPIAPTLAQLRELVDRSIDTIIERYPQAS